MPPPRPRRSPGQAKLHPATPVVAIDRPPTERIMGRVEAVVGELRDAMVKGEIAPGVPLIDARLAERLGASRSTIRIALHRLQQEGFVVAASLGTYSRAVVAPLRKEDAWELACIIGELEGLAAEWAARLARAARTRLVRELRKINASLAGLARKGRADPAHMFELDAAFHRRYVEVPGGMRLLALHDSIKPQWERYGRVYSGGFIERLEISVAEHEQVVRAIEAGRADMAHGAVRDTWRNGAERLAEYIDALGERGNG